MHSFEVLLGMKALIEAHFQHEALPHFIENVRFLTQMKIQKNAFNS